MADTRDFDILHIARSDGADTGPGYWPVSTIAPKKPGKDVATTEKTPRAKPQMTRLAEDDPRFAEWKIKLGILLKQELSPNPDEGNPWLVQFPRGYWLYEKSKHLWVSGYPIKAKLYKSPQEFGVHLIWLLSASKDYNDCCCIHCNYPNPAKLAASAEDQLIITPSETPLPLPTATSIPTPKSSSNTPTPVPVPAVPHRVTPVPLPPMPGQSPQKQTPPSTVATLATAALSTAPKPTPPKQGSKADVQAPLRPSTDTPPQLPAATQQQPPQAQQPQPVRWSLQGSLLFRAGELVWYQNGNTWRIGIIAAPGAGTYPMLPIGHAMVPQQTITKTDADIRPFHAFSVPPVSVPELKDKAFDQIPWDSHFNAAANDPAKREILALDASKLSASLIDASYSLWCPLAEDPNTDPFSYYGCFFGAERVEIGDCLRVKSVPSEPSIAGDHAVMGLRYIFTRKDYPGAVFFRGNIYQLAAPDSAPTSIVSEDQLPIALRDESQWRKQINPAKPWSWVMTKENMTLNEQFIKGRFYPTHRLMPILNPEPFHAAVARGQVDDQYPYLNNRMDGTGNYVGRKMSRMDSIGLAVPPGSTLGLEPAIREEGSKIQG